MTYEIATRYIRSISAQVIHRGTRSAGYGFVSVPSVDVVEKAVAELHGKELDGRTLIVEAATSPEDKEKKRSERRKKRTPGGRRGNKAPQGEVTEAEANGEAAPEAAATEGAPTTGGEPAKKRSRKFVSFCDVLTFTLVADQSPFII